MIRYTCIECPNNEFTVDQNENCEKCVQGGICLNGILLNQAGFSFIIIFFFFFLVMVQPVI